MCVRRDRRSRSGMSLGELTRVEIRVKISPPPPNFCSLLNGSGEKILNITPDIPFAPSRLAQISFSQSPLPHEPLHQSLPKSVVLWFEVGEVSGVGRKERWRCDWRSSHQGDVVEPIEAREGDEGEAWYGGRCGGAMAVVGVKEAPISKSIGSFQHSPTLYYYNLQHSPTLCYYKSTDWRN